MIEEFMVMANEAVSRKFSEFPFLYRIHEKPLEESREKLIVLLNLFSIDFKFKNFDTKEV
jgi:ribonuclease R